MDGRGGQSEARSDPLVPRPQRSIMVVGYWFVAFARRPLGTIRKLGRVSALGYASSRFYAPIES